MTTTINNEHKKLNVPNLRFKEFQGEWEKCKLGEIATICGGYAFNSRELSSEKGLYQVVKMGNLYQNNLDLSRTPSFINYIDSKSNKVLLHYGDIAITLTGTNNKRDFGYYIPKSKEQRKIADLLRLIDERIATQSKVIDKLQSLIKGIAHKISKQGKPNTRLTECLQCSSSTLQESDVAEFGLYPVYGANGIVGSLDTYNTTGEAIYIIKDGSGVGTVSYVTGKCSATGTLNILQAKDGFSLRYLYFILKVFGFEPYKTGMAIPHIYFKDYGKAKIYCPTYELQNKYADLLSKIEQKAITEQNILGSLCSQKQYLLRQMFI